MSDNGGEAIYGALQAIRDLHSDASRLLIDLDGWMDERGYARFGDDQVTRGISLDVKKGLFMAEGLYRRWKTPSLHSEGKGRHVYAVNIVFFDQTMKLTEPILIGLVMTLRDPASLEKLYWAPWTAFDNVGAQRCFNQRFDLAEGAIEGSVEGGAVYARRLFDVTCLENATSIFTSLEETVSQT